MIRIDFFNTWRSIVSRTLDEALVPLRAELAAIPAQIVNGIDQNDAARKAMQDAVADRANLMVYLGNGIPSESHFVDAMSAQILSDKLGDEFARPVYAIGRHLQRMYQESKQEGNLTDEALAFMQELGRYDTVDNVRKIKESKYSVY